jgi:hypothetical protein
MALRIAIANGNWSNPSTWYLGVKPAAGDIVASNGFTVTIDENVNVDSITNTVQAAASIIPIMTGYTTPSGIASASSEYGNPYFAWRAFDGLDISAGNYWLTTNGAFSSYAPQWLQYEFNTPTLVQAYSVKSSNWPANIPAAWEFQAWNGDSWVVLDTVSGLVSGSLNSVYNRSFANTTTYSRYRLFITAAVTPSTWVSIGELRLFENAADAVPSSVAGGGFVLTDGVNVVCTNPTSGVIVNVGNTLFTYAGSTSCSVTANDLIYLGYIAVTYYTFLHTGTGTLNLIGDFLLHGRPFHVAVYVQNNGILNYTGNITVGPSIEIRSRFLVLNGSLSVAYVTGNINTQSSASAFSNAVFGPLNGRLFITGSLIMGYMPIISSGESNLLSIVGPISFTTIGNLTNQAPVIRSSSTAINLFSGPFICSPYGFMPYLCTRMHLIPTTTSYFEFRDETTNGAVQPGAIAPATQLVSPATIADNPNAADVRLGTVYSIGTQTGTLNMPHPNQVTYGVAVDNTFGNAVLTAASVWDYLVANITVENSIGMRLKNVATPQTVGAQLASLL